MTLFWRIPSPRKDLRLAVRYRVRSDVTWYSGRTENLSRSGVLLRINTTVRESAQLDLVLKVPARMLESAPCEIVCLGTVKRLATSPAGTPEVGVEFVDVATDTLDALIARL